MSNKKSLAYSEEFLFYRESCDKDNVYLNLSGRGLEFEASPQSVTLRIPLHIWEVIRQTGVANFDLIEKTDADLQEIVEREVEERIKLRENYKEKKNRFSIAFSASSIYGTISELREKQIESGMDYYRNERLRQQNILDRMKTIHKT